MRTLVSGFLVGVCLVASPALAQQHPWVPSGMYTASVPKANAPARSYGRAGRGDTVDPSGWRSGKPGTDELYDGACHSSHPVFSCPGA